MEQFSYTHFIDNKKIDLEALIIDRTQTYFGSYFSLLYSTKIHDKDAEEINTYVPSVVFRVINPSEWDSITDDEAKSEYIKEKMLESLTNSINRVDERLRGEYIDVIVSNCYSVVFILFDEEFEDAKTLKAMISECIVESFKASLLESDSISNTVSESIDTNLITRFGGDDISLEDDENDDGDTIDTKNLNVIVCELRDIVEEMVREGGRGKSIAVINELIGRYKFISILNICNIIMCEISNIINISETFKGDVTPDEFKFDDNDMDSILHTLVSSVIDSCVCESEYQLSESYGEASFASELDDAKNYTLILLGIGVRVLELVDGCRGMRLRPPIENDMVDSRFKCLGLTEDFVRRLTGDNKPSKYFGIISDADDFLKSIPKEIRTDVFSKYYIDISYLTRSYVGIPTNNDGSDCEYQNVFLDHDTVMDAAGSFASKMLEIATSLKEDEQFSNMSLRSILMSLFTDEIYRNIKKNLFD